MKISQKRKIEFQKFIFDWWKTHRRDLPWRHTHDPYKILVSEVMLQQTQVSRALPKYNEFLRVFPTVQALSQAPVSKVLILWKGMGYNRRALYLKRTAEAVMKEYRGTFPRSEKELTKLPGLGTYTARAILVFAYRQNVAMVDTNIRQIIKHFFFHDRTQKESVVQKIADELVPAGKSWEWHQALMDYGALELKGLGFKVKSDKESKTPFKETNRFYRGRIIDLLREKKYKESILLSVLVDSYGKPTDFFHTILSGLLKDSLIRRSRGFISLP